MRGKIGNLFVDVVRVLAIARGESRESRIVIYPGVEHHMGANTGHGWLRISGDYQAEVARFLALQRTR